MITTFIDMRSSLLRKLAAIIGVALLLAGCSATRLAYNNAPQLAWWWIDNYLDFGSEQSPRVKEQLDRLFVWHRQTQLTEYAAFVAAIVPRVGEPVTPAQVCAWYADARVRLQPAYDRALQAAADIVPTLQPAQLATFERRLAKNNEEFRKDYMQEDLAARRKASLQRAVERAERFYGKLDARQRQVLEAAQASSPFSVERWQAERERRQQETLASLRRWVEQGADRGQVLVGLKLLADRAERSPDPDYRRYQQQLTDHNCRVSAELHNAAGPRQREALRRQLLEWEADLRALAAQAAP